MFRLPGYWQHFSVSRTLWISIQWCSTISKKQFALITLRHIYNGGSASCNHILSRKCVTWASSNTNAHELHHTKHPQASIRALRKAQDLPSWFVNFSNQRLNNFVMGNSAIFSISRQLMELIQNCKWFIWEVIHDRYV